jgi:glyoxylase-like metal-dependent hydrolase (beta-lactamase superfamily II)
MAKMKNFAEPATKHGIPDRTYKDKLTLLTGNDSIDLYYFGPAHTNGDTFVVFRTARVLHSGDAFANKGQPFIDRNNGGSGVAYPQTLARVTKEIKNVETVIPGHSAVTNWQAFVDYGDFIQSWVSSVTAAAKAGKTAEQAVSEFKPADKFAGYNMSRAKANVDVIYKEVQR